MRGGVHEGGEEGLLLVEAHHLLQRYGHRSMLPVGGQIFVLGGREGPLLGVLAEEVKDFSGRVGGEGLLCEGGQEVLLGAGGDGDSLLEVLLAFLLDFEELEEELLGVGAHLRGGARFHACLDLFPIFPEGHQR